MKQKKKKNTRQSTDEFLNDDVPAGRVAPAATSRDYYLPLNANLDSELLRTMFRHAVERVKHLLTGKMLGLLTSTDPDTVETDRKLIAGELDYLVPPGATVYYKGQPMVAFKPSMVVVDDRSADAFQVCDVKVGRNSQLIATGYLPASAFKATVSREMSMDTAQISMVITVGLVNTSGKPQHPPSVLVYGKGV